jgi:hypothetical protein
MKPCKNCGSWAINHNCHGRDGTDPDLCDVCYWRVRVDRVREACAVIADAEASVEGIAQRIAAAIRARGTP